MAPRPADRTRWSRLLLACGAAAPVVFVGVFVIDGAARRGYDPAARFVSELSLGGGGWVQIAAFIVTGALIIAFARGVALALASGTAAKAAPAVLGVLGLCLLLSGPVVTDSSVPGSAVTVHGAVHGVLGAVVFTLAPVSCFVLVRWFRTDPATRAFAAGSLVVGLLLVLGVVLLKVSQLPASPLFDVRGIVQRGVLVLYLGWLATTAVRLMRAARRRA